MLWLRDKAKGQAIEDKDRLWDMAKGQALRQMNVSETRQGRYRSERIIAGGR